MSGGGGPRSELTVSDLATWKGCSRWTAWRLLAKLERQHGDHVVRRRGRQLYTTRDAMARVATESPPEIDRRIERRLADLESNSRDRDQRIDGLSRALQDLRREIRRLASVGPKGQSS
jgi:hypothetical protein